MLNKTLWLLCLSLVCGIPPAGWAREMEDPYRCCEGELCGEGTEEDPYYTVTYAEYHDGSHTGPQFWGPWEDVTEHNALLNQECRELPACDEDGPSRCLDDQQAEAGSAWVQLD